MSSWKGSSLWTLSWPPLHWLQHVHLLPVLRTLELDTAPQVGLREQSSRTESSHLHSCLCYLHCNIPRHISSTHQAAHRASQSCVLLQHPYTLGSGGLLPAHQPWHLHPENKFSNASTRLSINPFPLEKDKHKGGDMPRLFPFQCDQSHNNTVHYPASPTLWFQTAHFMPGWSHIILLQDTLQVIERKWNTDLQQLNFWLDRRFGSSEGFSGLTWFQHLPGNRFSIHLYPLLWSTSTWAAFSQVPAWIWASGAAPAITAGIHPVKAKPATSCHCSENQETLRKENNSSFLPHFPKGEWTTPQWLAEVQAFNWF